MKRLQNYGSYEFEILMRVMKELPDFQIAVKQPRASYNPYRLSGLYISLTQEEEFLEDPNFFIENTYQKCPSVDKYKISKIR